MRKGITQPDTERRYQLHLRVSSFLLITNGRIRCVSIMFDYQSPWSSHIANSIEGVYGSSYSQSQTCPTKAISVSNLTKQERFFCFIGDPYALETCFEGLTAYRRINSSYTVSTLRDFTLQIKKISCIRVEVRSIGLSINL